MSAFEASAKLEAVIKLVKQGKLLFDELKFVVNT